MQEADCYAISCSLFIRIVIIATISVVFNILLYFWILRGMFLWIRSIGRVAAVFFRRKNPTDFLLRKSMGFYQHLFS